MSSVITSMPTLEQIHDRGMQIRTMNEVYTYLTNSVTNKPGIAIIKTTLGKARNEGEAYLNFKPLQKEPTTATTSAAVATTDKVEKPFTIESLLSDDDDINDDEENDDAI
jgi:hypothetical protein